MKKLSKKPKKRNQRNAKLDNLCKRLEELIDLLETKIRLVPIDEYSKLKLNPFQKNWEDFSAF